MNPLLSMPQKSVKARPTIALRVMVGVAVRDLDVVLHPMLLRIRLHPMPIPVHHR